MPALLKEKINEINDVWEKYQQYIDQLITQKNININSQAKISTLRELVSDKWSVLSENLKSELLSETMPEHLKESFEEFVSSVSQLNAGLKFAFPTFRSQLAHQLQTLCYKFYNYFFAGHVRSVVEGNAHYSFYRKPCHNVTTYYTALFAPTVNNLKAQLRMEVEERKQAFESTTVALTNY